MFIRSLHLYSIVLILTFILFYVILFLLKITMLGGLIMVKATYMFQDYPMLELQFKKGHLISSKKTGYIAPLPHANFPLQLGLKDLETFLFTRRIASGRPYRNKRYFEGNTLTPLEELRYHKGADLDDECWLKFEGDSTKATDLFGVNLWRV